MCSEIFSFPVGQGVLASEVEDEPKGPRAQELKRDFGAVRREVVAPISVLMMEAVHVGSFKAVFTPRLG